MKIQHVMMAILMMTTTTTWACEPIPMIVNGGSLPGNATLNGSALEYEGGTPVGCLEEGRNTIDFWQDSQKYGIIFYYNINDDVGYVDKKEAKRVVDA